MARPSCGVVFVGIISTLCGLGMTGVSSWILHKTLQMQKNANLDHAKGILEQLENFSGIKTGIHTNFDPIFRILISTSAAALAGGCVQFITSFCLLLCGVSGKLRKSLAIIWLILEILCLLSVGGAVLCILTNELKITSHLQIFMISAGADVVVIISSCVILACSAFRESAASSQNGGSRFPALKARFGTGGKTKASAPSLTPGRDVELYTIDGDKNSKSNSGGNMYLSVQRKIANYENNDTLRNSHVVGGRPSSIV